MRVEKDGGTQDVVPYREEYGPAFAKLNLAWLEKYFVVEAVDRVLLGDPVGEIIEPGGEVFFVREGGSVMGTCALLRKSEEVFELAKMAVDEAARGRGYARLLMDAAIAFARSRGAKELMLESNTILAPAIGLYRKYGFKEVPPDDHSEYARSNIRMVLSLDDASAGA